MKIVLLSHVKGLGQKGQVVDVSEGYFRNALAPKKLASIATEGAVKHIQAQKEKSVEKLQAIEESAKAVYEKINKKTLQLKEKTHDGGKLYASVHERELAEAIKTQLMAEVPAKNIVLEAPLKQLGSHTFKVKLSSSLIAQVYAEITSE